MSDALTPPTASPTDLLQQALEHHKAGAQAEADRLYRAVLAIRPGDADALRLLGFLEQERGRFSEARHLLSAALRIRSDDASGWARLAVVLSALNALPDALSAYERAVALDAEMPDAWNGRGNTLVRLGRLDEALESYDRVLSMAPDHVPALTNRGVALRDLGRTQEAIDSFDAALQLRPDHVFAHNNRGVALMDLGRSADALASFERALQLKPDYAEAWGNRGRALASGSDPLEGMGRAEEALTSFDRAVAINPAHAEALDNKGVLLIELGRTEEAVLAIERALRMAPRSARYYYHLTQARRLQPADPNLAAMLAMARDADWLSFADRIELDFALGQALDGAGDAVNAFRYFAEGNAMRRAQIAYDEASALGLLQSIREGFTPELVTSKAGKGDPSELPVFIVGMPRSGTTLIEQVLASRPDVFAAGETLAWPQAVGAQPTPGGKTFRFPADAKRLSAKGYGQIGERYVERLRAAAPGALRVVDKRPDNFRMVGAIHLALPNARIIVANRDPRDTCFSCYSKLFGAGAPYSFDLGELGRYYRGYARLMDHWRDLLPRDSLLEVEYEALVTDVEGQGRRILEFCGLDAGTGRIDHQKVERRIRTASALQVRQPVHSSAVGHWKRYEPFLGPLLQALESPISASPTGRRKPSRT